MLFTYPFPPAVVDILTITRGDLLRLLPDTYLNDIVIDFYQKFVFQDAPDVQVFNSHFYTQYCKHGFEKVERWALKVDIFGKRTIIVPICLDLHWSLGIVQWRPRLSITLLDSLGNYHRKSRIVTRLKKFFQQEWNAKKPGEPMTFSMDKLELLTPKTPIQTNSSDCGVYMLMFAQFYLQQYQTVPIEQMFSPTIFSPADVEAKRVEMTSLLLQLQRDFSSAKATVSST